MADRYLIETSGVDGYLLENGSGVLLLEGAAVPDSVPYRNPMIQLLAHALPFAAIVAALAH